MGHFLSLGHRGTGASLCFLLGHSQEGDQPRCCQDAQAASWRCVTWKERRPPAHGRHEFARRGCVPLEANPSAPVESSDETAALADILTATSRESLSQSHTVAQRLGHKLTHSRFLYSETILNFVHTFLSFFPTRGQVPCRQRLYLCRSPACPYSPAHGVHSVTEGS